MTDGNGVRLELVKAALTGILANAQRLSYTQAAKEAILVADLVYKELTKANGAAPENHVAPGSNGVSCDSAALGYSGK